MEKHFKLLEIFRVHGWRCYAIPWCIWRSRHRNCFRWFVPFEDGENHFGYVDAWIEIQNISLDSEVDRLWLLGVHFVLFAAISEHHIVLIVASNGLDGSIDRLVGIQDDAGLLFGELLFFPHEVDSQLAFLADEAFLFLLELRCVRFEHLADGVLVLEQRSTTAFDIFLSLSHLRFDAFHVGIHVGMVF